MKQSERDVNWVELGCRGWDVRDSGAGLYLGMDVQPLGDPSVCCENDFCHLDEETLELCLNGCPDFLRRVMDDLEAAALTALERNVRSTSAVTSTHATTWDWRP